jgi:hypothetical protein
MAWVTGKHGLRPLRHGTGKRAVDWGKGRADDSRTGHLHKGCEFVDNHKGIYSHCYLTLGEEKTNMAATPRLVFQMGSRWDAGRRRE